MNNICANFQIDFIFCFFMKQDHGKLAAVLLDDKLTDHDTFQTIVEKYPELTSSLETELSIYKLCITVGRMLMSVERFSKSKRNEKVVSPGIKAPQVIAVITKQLMDCRTVIVLRRLKTWLWSVTSQGRVNRVMVCHTQRERLKLLECPGLTLRSLLPLLHATAVRYC